ncbi:MAG: hypothetical protein V3V20_10990 [Algisphaera sp.]
MNASPELTFGFIALPVLLALFLGAICRSWRILAAALLWLAFTGAIAASGFLTDFSARPPRLLLLLGPTFLLTFILSFSSLGSRLMKLPLALLVGYQAFRIVIELLIHQAVVEGVAPPQMTWSGFNWDIASGITALMLAPWVSKAPRYVVLVWNTLALALLLCVVTVAILSVPGPFQQMKPDNTWVAYFPFVWLPTVAVVAALLGHIAVYRKLWQISKAVKNT